MDKIFGIAIAAEDRAVKAGADLPPLFAQPVNEGQLGKFSRPPVADNAAFTDMARPNLKLRFEEGDEISLNCSE
ncbi:hypothetical protein GCM10011503_09470 [Henriciella pelagia]|uniref:Uncharacterized protein n=1 Tax=Henriciella pelagia TaxID=1977912 RepID=A0ABQ1J958_9PROT|nr:hypothetical protein GCM10011503_09470 [Henriciella pelagia]